MRGRRRSPRAASRRTPSPAGSRRRARPPPASTSAITTRACSCASTSAMPRPTPLAPPVTTATLLAQVLHVRLLTGLLSSPASRMHGALPVKPLATEPAARTVSANSSSCPRAIRESRRPLDPNQQGQGRPFRRERGRRDRARRRSTRTGDRRRTPRSPATSSGRPRPSARRSRSPATAAAEVRREGLGRPILPGRAPDELERLAEPAQPVTDAVREPDGRVADGRLLETRCGGSTSSSPYGQTTPSTSMSRSGRGSPGSKDTGSAAAKAARSTRGPLAPRTPPRSPPGPAPAGRTSWPRILTSSKACSSTRRYQHGGPPSEVEAEAYVRSRAPLAALG